MENNLQNIAQAIRITDELIPMVEQAEREFKSARNWGFLDVMGGGFIVDLIKHSKLNNASSLMNEINYRLGDLQRSLGGINIPVDYRVQVGGFETFADFVFDGALADMWMTGRIMSSLKQVSDLKDKLYRLRDGLRHM